MKKEQKLFEKGKFFLGCNWWASHAGTNMWHDWREDVVEEDVRSIKAAGIDVMRVFPLWPDFQPLRMHYADKPRELRLREEPLSNTEEGRAGVDPIMIERFDKLCDIAEKYGVKLIVGLVTGWMSGRMYAPEAFLGKDLIKDPEVVSWQIRFVKYMVKRFKGRSAIAAWDLGNECNVMGAQHGVDRHSTYLWASAITNAIKSEDTSRLVISGMHGTLPDDSAPWNSRDLGEILDVLCTHPYPIFTPHCDTDPINEMKSILHATAESSFYAGMSGKPCFVEEIGTLGPMISSEEVAGDYIRASAFSSWAHGLHGFVWWCAHEQYHLTHTPYDWNSVERELGFMRKDRTPKPVLVSMGEISRFVDSFKYGALPERIKDASVIITNEIDSWAVAYGSFILAKQAGLDIDLVHWRDELPESKVYMLPSLSGDKSIPRSLYVTLEEKVRSGATLYISIEDALLSPFRALAGLKVNTRYKRTKCDTLTIDGKRLSFDSAFKLNFETDGAKVLLSLDDGSPAVTEYRLGMGRVIFVCAPIEARVGTEAGLASGDYAVPYYRIYEMLGLKSGEKCASSSDECVCITEHKISDNERILTVLNHRPIDKTVNISLQDGFAFKESFDIHGTTRVNKTESGFSCELEKNTGFVAVVAKN